MVIRFSQRALDAIFPYAMGTDADGIVVTIGRSLRKLAPLLKQGSHFQESFRVTTPNIGPDAYNVRHLADEIVTLELLDGGLRFKGQVAPLEEGEARTFLFVVSPFFTDIADIAKAGLDFGDFALFDPIFDLLMLIQSERRASLESAEAKHHLEQANAILKQEMTERIKIEQSLQLAKEAAEAANRAKSQFLANMSHEIRTPLNAIIGTASVLVSDEVDEATRPHLERIRTSGDHLLALVNDILDFSKIEAGELSLERLDFDLLSLVDDVFGLIAEAGQAKGLTIAARLRGSLPTIVNGDPGRLRQVLLNLLSNAVKFTEKGRVVLSVRRQDPSATANNLVFEVQDTGIGVPLAKQARLFRPFSQADESDTRRYGGTGLGLAISKSLVEKMGGRIFMVSEPGVGTSFQVFLPLDAPAAELADKSTPAICQRALVVQLGKVAGGELPEQLEDWGMLTATVRSLDSLAFQVQSARALNTDFQMIVVDHEMYGPETIALMEQKFDQALLQRIINLIPYDSACEEAPLGATGLKKPYGLKQLKKAFGCDVSASDGRLDTNRNKNNLGSTKALKILVAEDNALNRDVVKAMLSRLSHQFEMAEDGLIATERVAADDYDLILMDCQMPQMDGFEATKRIRSMRGRKAEIPVIAMTANAIKGDRERCLQAGMDDYLAKPVKIADLKALLLKWSERLVVRFDAQASAEDLPAVTTVAVEVSHDHEVPLLDLDALEILRTLSDDGSDSFLHKQVSAFLAEAPQISAAILQAAKDGDYDNAMRLAHRFKTSCGIVGALRLATICEQLEAAGEAGRNGDVSQQAADVVRACPATLAGLQAQLRAA